MHSGRKIDVFQLSVQNRLKQKQNLPLHGIEVGGNVRQFPVRQQLRGILAALCQTLSPVKAKECEKRMRILKRIHNQPDGIEKRRFAGLVILHQRTVGFMELFFPLPQIKICERQQAVRERTVCYFFIRKKGIFAGNQNGPVFQQVVFVLKLRHLCTSK